MESLRFPFHSPMGAVKPRRDRLLALVPACLAPIILVALLLARGPGPAFLYGRFANRPYHRFAFSSCTGSSLTSCTGGS